MKTLENSYIAEVVSNFVRNAGPRHYLMKEVTEGKTRLYLSEYADHKNAEIVAMKTSEGHTILYINGRQLIRNPMNFDEAKFLEDLQSEGG